MAESSRRVQLFVIPAMTIDQVADRRVGQVCSAKSRLLTQDTGLERLNRKMAMRSSPHSGFSCPIRRISRRSSRGIGGRPGRDFIRQKSLHPSRCQRTIVAGFTITTALRQKQAFCIRHGQQRCKGVFERRTSVRLRRGEIFDSRKDVFIVPDRSPAFKFGVVGTPDHQTSAGCP